MRSLAEFSANSIKGSLNDEHLMRRRSWAIPLPRIGHKSVGNETHVNVPVAGFPLFARACLFGHADFRAALPSDAPRSAGAAMLRIGGRGGIRTHGGLAPTAVFKTAALNHSATLP